MILIVLLCNGPGESPRLQRRAAGSRYSFVMRDVVLVSLGLASLSCGDDAAEKMLWMNVSVREERQERFKKTE